MPNYIEKVEKLTLPVIALNGTVAFPSVKISLELTDEANLAAADAANDTNSYVLLVSYREISEEPLSPDRLYKVGTVAKIKQSIKTSEGNIRIIAEGYSRASVVEYKKFCDYYIAEANSKTVAVDDNGGLRGEAFSREAIRALEETVKFLPSVSTDILLAAKSIKNPGLLADFIASNILVKFQDKQLILECFEPMERIELLILLLEKEQKILHCEFDIHRQVRSKISRYQKEYYLREQLKVIQNELGEGTPAEDDDYYQKILAAKLPAEVEEKLLKENERLQKTPFGSAEAGLLRNYLDTCLELPWANRTRDRVDVAAAAKILNAEHDGLEEVKDRILEYLAVKQLNPELKNQILCLVGPPGVGKTSIAASIAHAMKRKYVRVSLGGVRDEADIRGHRKTYIGAMPGRIITALGQAGVNNPLILLDEIDKLTADAHGDPTSALLEVLDGEQNKTFRDHFIELPFDLSDCFFVATANTLRTVPRPLIDRMEIIELPIYTKREKINIATNHLLPKQIKRHGLNRRMLKIPEETLAYLIDRYTKEAGVRNLERALASLCRKAARKLLSEDCKRVVIDLPTLKEFLGPEKIDPEQIASFDEVGTVNGLAYTELGGDLLKIEVAILEGTGKIELTGSLGEVMQESAKIAVSVVRSLAAEYHIPSDFYKTRDIHIHAPEGAVPKDGPSAGVAMTCALVSALTGRPLRRDVAMTGEVTLRGRVLAIGGLKEKTMAAYSAGVHTVLIPADNEKDLDKIDSLARENLTFLPCRHVREALAAALVEESFVTPEYIHREESSLVLPEPILPSMPVGRMGKEK